MAKYASRKAVEPVAQAVAGECGGNAAAQRQFEEMFPQFERGNWRIVNAIQRIWAGERDLDALTDDIDRNSALIVRRIQSEEAMLAAAFGEDYERYRQQVPWRLVPYVF